MRGSPDAVPHLPDVALASDHNPFPPNGSELNPEWASITKT
jgi:hypothetical protein